MHLDFGHSGHTSGPGCGESGLRALVCEMGQEEVCNCASMKRRLILGFLCISRPCDLLLLTRLTGIGSSVRRRLSGPLFSWRKQGGLGAAHRPCGHCDVGPLRSHPAEQDHDPVMWTLRSWPRSVSQPLVTVP